MRLNEDKGFSLIELLVVLFIFAAISFIGWQSLRGWRERNALRTVSQDVKYIFEKYRQRAVDKGYNYGLLFSDDGIYVFEDNGGTSAQPFLAMNNYAIDNGEYSDLYRGVGSGDTRQWRRVSRAASEYKFFTGTGAEGRIIIMTSNSLGIGTSRSGSAYSPEGTDITASAAPTFSGGDIAPFIGGTLALFFSPDGNVYLKDPTVAIPITDRRLYQLGTGAAPFYVVRIAYDDTSTSVPDIPNYYEIAINRYGASTYTRWHSGDGGANWNAEVQ